MSYSDRALLAFGTLTGVVLVVHGVLAILAGDALLAAFFGVLAMWVAHTAETHARRVGGFE